MDEAHLGSPSFHLTPTPTPTPIHTTYIYTPSTPPLIALCHELTATPLRMVPAWGTRVGYPHEFYSVYYLSFYQKLRRK